MLIAGFVVGILGFLVGLVALRRLRAEFMGIALLSIGLVIYSVVANYPPLFDAANGLYNVPPPFFDVLNVDVNTYSVFYIVIAVVAALICYVVLRRVDRAPLGRLMRATREDTDATESLGKNSFKIRMTAMILGCVFGGIGGALLIAYNTTFDPGSWMTVETFVAWTALIMGGAGNNIGAILGVFILFDVVGEPTRLLPTIAANPALFSAIRFVLIGVVLLLVLRFRPRGMLPERRPSARWLLGNIGVAGRDPSGQ
jgi:ABC-type branched-subunit amino acid transport system permease subunit